MPAWAWAHSNEDPYTILFNGDFSQVVPTEEGLVPDHWLFQAKDPAFAVYQFEEFKVPVNVPALRIGVNNSKALLLQPFNRLPVGAFTLSGNCKKDEGVELKTSLQIIFKDSKRKPTSIAIENLPAKDWTPFTQVIQLPAGTEVAVLGFEVKGQGRVWLDDLSVVENKK